MARQTHSKQRVKGHYRTYYVGHWPDEYKKIKKWIEPHDRKVKKLTRITQKRNVKDRVFYDKTMVKKIPQNLIDSIKALVKNETHEYSIDIDFERHLDTPEQMLVMKGGFGQTIKVGDFEMFGHSHPNRKYPHPSNVDLRHIRPLKPEFIVAGKTGKALIMNIEDYDRWQKYRESGKDVTTTWTDTQYGREKMFEWTGVRFYPFVKNLEIEVLDDPIREKKFPRASEEYISAWHIGESKD